MQHTQPNSVVPVPENEAAMPDITIYVEPQNADSQKLREYLHRRHVPFFEHDVTRDNTAQEFLSSLDIDKVPVTRVGDEIVVGFDELFLNELIKTSETAAVNV